MFIEPTYDYTNADQVREVHNAATKDSRRLVAITRQLMSLAQQYYPTTGSHSWEHIQACLRLAVDLLPEGYTPVLSPVETAAIMFHDCSEMGNPEERDQHELLSAKIAQIILQSTSLFTSEELDAIAGAIARHRASYKGPRPDFLSNLVAAADRGYPDLDHHFPRAIAYVVEHYPHFSDKECALYVRKHLHEKYGAYGYAWDNIPSLYLERYWKEVQHMQQVADNIDLSVVLIMVRTAYQEKLTHENTGSASMSQ